MRRSFLSHEGKSSKLLRAVNYFEVEAKGQYWPLTYYTSTMLQAVNIKTNKQ